MARDREKKRSLPVAPRARWTPELLAGVAEGERRALRPLFDQGVEGAVEAAAAAGERAEALARAALAREPPASAVACRKGCSACCVSKVVVVAPEVLRIARYLRAALGAEALAEVVERVRAADDKTRGLSRRERAVAGVSCPLLVEGACSVHEVRPLLCRGWTSLDAEGCERHFADPEGVAVPVGHTAGYELASAVLAGLGRAALDAGRDGGLLELVAALRIALERGNAGERWEGGMPVFLMAREGEG